MITLRYVKTMDIAEFFLYNKYLFCISNIMMMLIKICLVIVKGEISLEGHTYRNLRQLLNRAHTIYSMHAKQTISQRFGEYWCKYFLPDFFHCRV